MMVNKYIKYLPWVILGSFSSYLSATYYARNSFDLFYLTLIFLIADRIRVEKPSEDGFFL